ncbi:nuclease-related domain-containing protein [Cytobacillus oceanisediminis]|uniref:nuclease-related domain-containing protein n=1 Tax=Cytobacillus oceanisediminis TaxID=665099 RepID=UPI003734F4C2
MIVKKLQIPEINLKLEALLKRIAENHPAREKITSEYKKRTAGYKGEEKLSYYLSFLDQKEFWIFHDIRLTNGTYFFQIDALLLTKKFALILEVKNWTGTIIFDPHFHQLIRIQNNKEEGFHDPISQAALQASQLKKWLTIHGFPKIPVEYFVVISHPSTIIKTETDPLRIANKVIHSHRLLSKVQSIDKNYKQEAISDKVMNKLNRTLLKKHVPSEPATLQQLDISSDDILSGVYCPNCSSLPMIFHWGKWHCTSCNHSSHSAHEQTIQDYFLLIKPTITNSEFRTFSHLSSLHTASRMLSKMQLPFKRDKRHRFYEKPPL